MESRFSVEENVACSCFNREGRLEALQLGFTPTSTSSITRDKGEDQLRNRKKKTTPKTNDDSANLPRYSWTVIKDPKQR